MTELCDIQTKQLVDPVEAVRRHVEALMWMYQQNGQRKDDRFVLDVLHEAMGLLKVGLIHDYRLMVDHEQQLSLRIHLETGERFDVTAELVDD